MSGTDVGKAVPVEADLARRVIEPPERIPVAAGLLGGLGLIPFAVGALVSLLGPASSGAYAWCSAYGAVILSFMGGAQWGLAMARAGAARTLGLSVSVLPALVGWVALAMPARPRLVILIVGFALLLAYDLWTVREGDAPGWYGRLRIRLTVCVIGCMLAAVAAGR